MKFQYLLFSFCFLLLISCNKDGITTDCIKEKIRDADMTPYNGESLSCELYMELWIWNEEQYFVVGSHCIDYVINPVDCAGNPVCREHYIDPNCQSFFSNAVNTGIIAYKKQ